MLILKEPIKLKSLSPMISPSDGFFERMDANYKQIQAKYGSEELFHLLNQPPQVYIEEGGMTTLVTQNQQNQEIRLDMIYNLFNRLMMSDSSDFTYQDAVFVQNMLEKLGVRNVSEFMEQLHEIQEDTKNTKQLLNIYQNHTEVLGRIVESAKMQEEQKENNTFPSYWIHNQIFERLQTGNVYHTAIAFQDGGTFYQGSIDGREAELARQAHMSESLRLQSLENSILMQETPLLEHRVNIYEEGIGEGSYEKNEITNELAQAVLLNISENLYQTGMGRRDNGKKAWYQFKGDFHQILEDTLNRFYAYHFQDIHYVRRKDGGLYQRNVNALRTEKIEKLNKILEISAKADAVNTELYRAENPGTRKMAELDVRTVQQRDIEAARQEAVRIVQQGDIKTVRQENVKTARDERIHRVTAAEELQILNEINAANRRPRDAEESLETRRVQERRLTEEVRILNEANRRRMEETKEKEELHKRIISIQINKERTRKEVMLLLEHPELSGQYKEEQEKGMAEESIGQVQRNLVREEAKLRQEYAALLEQTVRVIKGNPAEEEARPEGGREKEQALPLLRNSPEGAGKGTEAETAGQIQDLAGEEVKLRREYMELLEQVGQVIKESPVPPETEKKEEGFPAMEYLEQPVQYTEEAFGHLLLLHSSLKKLEKRMETESTEQVQHFVREEAKLRREYARLWEQSVRERPTEEGGGHPAASAIPGGEETKARESIEEIRTAIRENAALSEIKRKEESRPPMEYLEQPVQYTEEVSERLQPLRSDLEELEKRMETESTKRIQNLVREEAKLRREYAELSEPAGGKYTVGGMAKGLESMEEIRTSIGENPVSPEIKRTVLTYLDIVSKEQLEEEIYQSERHTSDELKTESIRRELIHIRREDVQDMAEQIKRQEYSRASRQTQQGTVLGNQNIQLYHREPDVFTGEMLEGVTSPEVPASRTEEVNNRTDTQKIVTKRQIHRQVDKLVKKDSERISEMINKGVQRQLNTISEQVYRKLEKKLSNDRKRRGY